MPFFMDVRLLRTIDKLDDLYAGADAVWSKACAAEAGCAPVG